MSVKISVQEQANPEPRIERTFRYNPRGTPEQREALRRAVEEAPEGSEAAEWGPNPDLDHGSLKKPKGVVTPG